MWIQSDSDIRSSINFQGVCVTRLMCRPLAGNFWSTPVLVPKELIHGVMTSLPWQTGLQSWQSCTIALAHSVGYKWRSYQDSPSEGLISYMWIQSDSDLTSLINFQGVCVTRLMCSPLGGNFWSTPVLVHKGLIHGVMTSLPWQTGLQSWQSCTIALAHSVGYKWCHGIGTEGFPERPPNFVGLYCTKCILKWPWCLCINESDWEDNMPNKCQCPELAHLIQMTVTKTKRS